MKTVSIVGVGLIGGSFALALREAGFSGEILGVSSPATLAEALKLGVIDRAVSLEEAGQESDLIYLSQPIEQILTTIERLGSHVRPGTLITDAGSTKRAIVEHATVHLKNARFVGGHPMAGKESRGVAHAEAGLFCGRPYVLTDRNPLLAEWIERIGANLVVLNAEQHDQMVAVSSHLPQMASVALARMIGNCQGAERVAGPGAIDMTRLAMSAYDIWHDILATNQESIDQALAGLIEQLEALRVQLSQADGTAMAREFEQAAAVAHILRERQE